MFDPKKNMRQKIALGTAILVASCWLIYFLFAPTIGFDLVDSWHNEQRALQIALLLITSLSYLWLLLECKTIPVVRATVPVWIVFVVGAISACLAALPIHAFAEVALCVQLVFLGTFFATLMRVAPRQSSLAILYSAWLIGAVYLAGVAANFVGVIVEQRSVDMQVFVLGYANRRFASALHALILPLIAWLAFDRSIKPSLRYSSWAIAILLWTINLAMGTRAIWAAYFAAGVVYWWQGGHEGRRTVKAVSATAAIGTLAFLLVWIFAPFHIPQEDSMTFRIADVASDSGRFDLWQTALTAILKHPWFGIGPMHFAKLHATAGAHPHNWLLQIASEWGLPALIVVLSAIYIWGRNVRGALANRIQSARAGTLPPIAFSVIAALFYGLLDGNWVMPVSQSLAAILVGVSIGLLPDRKPSQLQKVFNVQNAAVMSVVLATSLFLALYATRTLAQQLESEKKYTERFHTQYFLPRFWQQGYIFEGSAE